MRSPAIVVSNPAAIWLRPALCTQTKRTSGRSVPIGIHCEHASRGKSLPVTWRGGAMHSTTLLIVIVVAVVALVVIGVVAAVMRRSRMRSLPEESKQRYAASWREIEARFVEDPAAAVRDAHGPAGALPPGAAPTAPQGHTPEG